MEFKITNIKKQDKNKVYKLIEEINEEDNLNYSLTEEWLDYVIENAGDGIFLGFYGERLVGLGTSMINNIYKDQGALNVVVSSDYREKGLGSMLYDKTYNYAKIKDVEVVEAYVKKRLDHGLRFAKKRGFNTVMYSWEMELDLHKNDFNFEKQADLNFRKASKEDIVNYKDIIYKVFGDEVGEDYLAQISKDSSIIIYILEKEKEIIGTVTIQIRKNLSLAYIYDIAILEEHRGQGLGSYLVKSSIRSLKEKNIDKASLLVTGENKTAIELYRKIGFREVDIDLIMTKKVE